MADCDHEKAPAKRRGFLIPVKMNRQVSAITKQALATMTGRSIHVRRLTPLLILGFGFFASACTVPVEVSRQAPIALVTEADVAETVSAFEQPAAQVRAASAVRLQPQIARRGQVNVIGNDNGGDLVEYAQIVSRARIENAQVAFRGSCASACTLYLSLSPSQTCIARGASFVFHRAYGARSDVNQWGTNYMLTRYPTWVRQWIEARGGLSDRLLRMDYSYASRHLRRCQIA
ncbi:hypothetical protein [Rhodophyticola porphyridii]|uniref:hypothetical protein n=1 Tax=Rhodophyticola porphyridii TaxID=1852017 RepID=UPI0011C35AFE|nr:hypothetical protein [Rhodophyticola porphyridii]